MATTPRRRGSRHHRWREFHRARYDRCLSLVDPVFQDLPDELQPAHGSGAAMLVTTGQLAYADDAEQIAQRGIGLLDRLDDVDTYWAKLHVSTIHAGISMLERANGGTGIEHAQMALDVARDIGNPTALCLALYSYGWAIYDVDPSRARPALEESILIAEEVSEAILVPALVVLAPLRFAQGDIPGALAAAETCVLRSREAALDIMNALATIMVAGLVLQQNEPATAATLLSSLDNDPFGPGTTVGTHVDRTPLVEACRAQLTEDEFDAAVTRGRRLDADSIVTLELATLQALSASLIPQAGL